MEYRFRKNWRGKQILQIRKIREHFEDVYNTGFFDSYVTFRWEDASEEEAQEVLEKING